MLKINDKECKLISEKLSFSNATINFVKGYSPLVDIKYILDDYEGYINFYVCFMNNKNFHNLEGKKFKSNPWKMGGPISCMEIYYNNFYIEDVDSDVEVAFNKILNNKIETSFYINDKSIKVEYNGLLEVK